MGPTVSKFLSDCLHDLNLVFTICLTPELLSVGYLQDKHNATNLIHMALEMMAGKKSNVSRTGILHMLGMFPAIVTDKITSASSTVSDDGLATVQITFGNRLFAMTYNNMEEFLEYMRGVSMACTIGASVADQVPLFEGDEFKEFVYSLTKPVYDRIKNISVRHIGSGPKKEGNHLRVVH